MKTLMAFDEAAQTSGAEFDGIISQIDLIK